MVRLYGIKGKKDSRKWIDLSQNNYILNTSYSYSIQEGGTYARLYQP